jgi:hypothetical protein
MRDLSVSARAIDLSRARDKRDALAVDPARPTCVGDFSGNPYE